MLHKKKPENAGDQEFLVGLDTPEPAPAPPGIKPFWKKNWKKLVAAAAAIAVAVAVLLPKRSAPVQASAQYVETKPQTRNITNTFSSSGTITAANTYTVKSLVKGTVLTADFEVGDRIEEGTVLYTIDSSDVSSNVAKAQLSLTQAQRSYEEAEDAQYLRSSIAGTVVSLKVSAGDLVSAGQEIATIRDDSTLLLTLDFPATDAAAFTAGQAAQVTLDGTFESLSGTVQSVSGADSLNSGNMLVRTVTIAVANNGNLTSAMAATAAVNGVSALGSAKFSYQREQTVTAQTGGTVAALCVTAGDTVGVDTALLRLSGKDLKKQVQSASDNLTSAQMSMEDAQKQLDSYTITSPISGTVIQKNVKAGDTVGTSTTSDSTLCIIYDLSYLEMTLNVDELEILSIKEGQNVEITADAISGQTFKGVVTSVSAAGTTNGGTTTYPVTVRIDETGDLLPGMNATAKITIASANDALSIPSAAVVRGNYVLVTSDSPSAANAASEMSAPDGYVYVKVTTGVSDDDSIQITDGLTAEDTIAYDTDTAKTTIAEDSPMMGDGNRDGGDRGGRNGGPGGGF